MSTVTRIEVRSAISLLHELEPLVSVGLTPPIVVYLSGGQILSGLFTGVRLFANESWGSLQVENKKDFTFFSLGDVTAITVSELPQLLEKAKRLASESPVTALEFRRKVSEKASRLGEVSVAVEIEPSLLTAESSELGRMLGAFSEFISAVAEVTSDEMGKKAFRSRVRSIHICQTAKQTILISDGRLSIDLQSGATFSSARWAAEMNPFL